MSVGAIVKENRLISIVIPAYNEERRIPSTLKSICGYLSEKELAFEVIVVDDGSSDGTAGMVEAISRGCDGIRIIRSGRNMGKGNAIRKGVMESGGELLLISDADLSTPIEELQSLMPAIEAEGFDIAIGSRGMKESRLEVRQPWYRETMGKTFNLFVRLLVVGGISDTQCGFKLFRGDVAREVFKMCLIDGFSYDVEALFIARKLGLRIKEVPVKWLNCPASKVSLISDPLKMLMDLIVIRVNWLRGAYR